MTEKYLDDSAHIETDLRCGGCAAFERANSKGCAGPDVNLMRTELMSPRAPRPPWSSWSCTDRKTTREKLAAQWGITRRGRARDGDGGETLMSTKRFAGGCVSRARQSCSPLLLAYFLTKLCLSFAFRRPCARWYFERFPWSRRFLQFVLMQTWIESRRARRSFLESREGRDWRTFVQSFIVPTGNLEIRGVRSQ